MLEATNFDSIDMLSLFIRAIADRSCSNVKSAPVPKAFTRNCDILQNVYRQGLRIGGIESKLRSLSKHIMNFKDHARSMFEHYLVSGMGTSNWHCLENLVDSLIGVGGIEIFHGSYYESAHKILKRSYRRTFKRSSSVVEKALNVLELQSSIGLMSTSLEAKRISNPSRAVSIQEKTTCLINSEKHDSSLNLKNVLKYVAQMEHFSRSSLSVPPFLLDLFRDTTNDAYAALKN